MKKPSSLYSFGECIAAKKKFKSWDDVLEALRETIEKFSLSETDLHFIQLGFNGDPISGCEPLMPFGQYSGKPLDKVPKKYLNWCAKQEWITEWPVVNQYLKDHNYERHL